MNPYIQYMYSYPHKTAYRSLEGVFLQDYARLLSGGGHGLYLHVPFCQAKCGYCNLFSVTGQKEEEMDRYLDAVERQAGQYREILSAYQPEFSEASVGGGTPLLLTEQQLERMFEILNGCFRYSKDRELWIETAPNQTVPEKLRILKQAGVTRVSMGIQSFLDSELKALGRQHGARRTKEALYLLKTFGFPCINVDLIYGILGQTAESLLASLKQAVEFAPDEIFLYPLYLKQGAWLTQDFAKRQGEKPETVYARYQEASAFLRGEGYRQDSMRRFVRRKRGSGGQEEIRSDLECGFGTSLALGCGGRSYLGNLHFCTPYAVRGTECLRQLRRFEETEDFSRITHGVLLSEEERKRRYVIRHLLIRPGLSLSRYRKHFGSDAREDFGLLQSWEEQGYVHMLRTGETEYLTLTETGLGLSDYLGPQLISGEVRRKMKEWEAVYGRQDDIVPGESQKL